MGQPFIGEIRMGGWTFAPVGWAFCDGSLQSIAQSEVLFQLIGTTYGGDGVQTYALPNLLGRLPVHQGRDSNGNTYLLGQIAGTENVTVNTAQLPSHTHTLGASTTAASQATPAAGCLPAEADALLYNTGSVVAMATATGLAGGSQPHNNLMPFLCINYIIALFGVFPSQ